MILDKIILKYMLLDDYEKTKITFAVILFLLLSYILFFYIGVIYENSKMVNDINNFMIKNKITCYSNI